MPKPSVVPNSSLFCKSSWAPKQIPKSGNFLSATFFIQSTNFRLIIDFIAFWKAPTPGKTIDDELIIFSC